MSVLLSVHRGGQSSGSKVNPAGGGLSGSKVKGQSSLGGLGQRLIQPGGVRSSWPWGGGSGPVRGGSGPVSRGGISILCPLAGSMPLAFMQEDFLVNIFLAF